jgi:hypothetical protein
MADIKIPDLPAVGTPAAGDLFEGVEIADTTDDPAGSSKYYTATQIVKAGGVDVRTAATWVSANPTLAAGVLGIESDTGVVRIGDGATAFISLSSGWRGFNQTAQVTNQDSTTSVDITGLAVPVQSGHVYKIEFAIAFQSATNTNGLTLLASGPAQTWGRWRCSMQQGANGTHQLCGGHSEHHLQRVRCRCCEAVRRRNLPTPVPPRSRRWNGGGVDHRPQ